jgi:hypothetical protein
MDRLALMSEKLLLVFSSTANLGFGPRRDPYRIFLLSKILRVLKWGLQFDERKGATATSHSPSNGAYLARTFSYAIDLTILLLKRNRLFHETSLLFDYRKKIIYSKTDFEETVISLLGF